MDFPSQYLPAEFEQLHYKNWEDKKYFHGDDKSQKPPFSIVLPPPNVTGALHMGHAVVLTIQDTIVRRKRMQGYNTVWFPGTDHAGIATQMVVEKELMKQNISRHDLGREKFLEKVWEVKHRHHGMIINQTRRMGVSLDWERERFSLDEKFNHAVNEVFVSLYKKGLVYRGEKLISWCKRCGTALSDLEVAQNPEKGKLYYMKYFLAENSSEYVVVATTRPETLLGDTAVAINPNDERFKHLHGKHVIIPFVNRKVPIITDEYVQMDFGTGCLKITPGHDFNDYEIGYKHKLESISVLNFDGKLNNNAGPFAGLTVDEARIKVVEELDKNSALEKIEPYDLQLGRCSRCDTVIEPMLSKQWFVKMDGMAKKATDAVKDGKIKFYPQGWWENTYYNWMENIRDWCVSRQLWWGHRLPVWYCTNCGHFEVMAEMPEKPCVKCGHSKWDQDSDVLDTWFSAALWPFVAFGWPEKTQALKTFYPNQLMETGFDIIFFWVARMIMFGMEFMGDVPFKEVLYHAMVRDEKGQKMSKTRGNVIDPLQILDKMGTDALRFTLASNAGRARDIRLSNSIIEGFSHFMNKIWQASKFIFMNAEGFDEKMKPEKVKNPINKWIISRLNSTMEQLNKHFEEYALGDVSDLLYKFFWYEFCDWYIEFSKPLINDPAFSGETKYTLLYIQREFLKAAHPIIPFITEEIYLKNPLKEKESVMIDSYPQTNEKLIHKEIEAEFELVQQAVVSIRNIRAIYGIKGKMDVTIASQKYFNTLNMVAAQFKKIAQINDVKIVKKTDDLNKKDFLRAVLSDVEILVPAKGTIDVAKETERLSKKFAETEKELSDLNNRLANPRFLEKAAPELVQKEKLKVKELGKVYAELKDALEVLSQCAG